MPHRLPSLVDEFIGAARGVAGLAVGDRGAPARFASDLRGLCGSFIALLLATTFSAYAPLDGGDPGIPASGQLAMSMLIFALQLGFSALVLRQLHRLDRFVPYLVADNWTSFFVTLLAMLMVLAGLPVKIVIMFVGLVLLVVEINIARLVVGLKFWPIVLLLAAQLVAGGIGLLLIGIAFPDMAAPPSG